MLEESRSTFISILTIKHPFIIWFFKFVPLSKLQETSIILATREHRTGKTKFKLEATESQNSLVWIQDAVIFHLVFFVLLRHTIELRHQWIQHKEHQRDIFLTYQMEKKPCMRCTLYGKGHPLLVQLLKEGSFLHIHYIKGPNRPSAWKKTTSGSSSVWEKMGKVPFPLLAHQ